LARGTVASCSLPATMKFKKVEKQNQKLTNFFPQRRWAFFLPTTTAVVVSAKAERRVHAHNKAGWPKESH
jgi:hypothetical protein